MLEAGAFAGAAFAFFFPWRFFLCFLHIEALALFESAAWAGIAGTPMAGFDASLSEDLFEDAALFVVDDVPQYLHYMEQGYFTGYPADPVELSDALVPQAEHPPGLRVFAPLGIALEDVAVAAEINRRAAGAGLGRELPL